MTREDLQQAIFGSFDGLTSALGVITGLIVAGTHTPARGFSPAHWDSPSPPPSAWEPASTSPTRAETSASPSSWPPRPSPAASSLTIGHYRGYRLTLSILVLVLVVVVVAAVTVALTAAVA